MTIHAYSKLYLDRAMINLGAMLDFATNTLNYHLEKFYSYFLVSCISKAFEKGEANIVVGRSGIELAYDVLETLSIEYERKEQSLFLEKSKEYWAGWALAYYQWKYNETFSNIDRFISIEEILSLYHPYHEMDIESFCDKLEEIRKTRKECTNLKQRRMLSSLTQRELSEASGVPLRTLQEYEQGKKNINNAKAIYVANIAQILNCNVKDLLER